MIIFLLELPVLFLLSGKGKTDLLLSFSIYLIFCTTALFIQKKRNSKFTGKIRYPFLTMVLCLAAASVFSLRWNTSGRISTIAESFNKGIGQTCIFIALGLAVLSAPGIDTAVQMIANVFSKKQSQLANTYTKAVVWFYIFLTAILVITLNSTCSPFYPINRWADPNTTFTVGKAVLKGYVPYRDLYELKGPLFIFLHTLGAAISFDSFHGIWILEILFCFAFLYLSYKVLMLYFSETVLLLIPSTAIAAFLGFAFRTGDSAEEFCIPLLMYGLYVGSKSIVEKKIPSKLEFFLIGITSSCVFWIKYSMVGFYIGWILFLFFYSIQKKQFKKLVEGAVFIVLGLIPVSVLILIYFTANNSLPVLFETYFGNNFDSMHSENLSGLIQFTLNNLKHGLQEYMQYNPVVFVLALAGILWTLIKKQWQMLFFLTASYLGTFLSVYIRGYLPYYPFIMGAFTVYGLFWAAELLRTMKNKISVHYSLTVYSMLFSLTILCFFSHNMFWLDTKKEDLMQYKMKEVIKQSGIENPTLFYYGTLDLGINTAAGIIPNMRYFCGFNNININESIEEQAACLNEGCVDYVTAFTIYPDSYPDFPAYKHAGWFIGPTDTSYGYYHYYTRK